MLFGWLAEYTQLDIPTLMFAIPRVPSTVVWVLASLFSLQNCLGHSQGEHTKTMFECDSTYCPWSVKSRTFQFFPDDVQRFLEASDSPKCLGGSPIYPHLHVKMFGSFRFSPRVFPACWGASQDLPHIFLDFFSVVPSWMIPAIVPIIFWIFLGDPYNFPSGWVNLALCPI